ncbi:hypothetical protein E4T38_06672 [Aureobasidium subglaciale]|nr:hypothetical protein E4T38_06672 [Aureobasidium subglaciale]KAI5218038.1 hypothetical protein E4T40_07059 [Aureobasidium subglaciale]KAI5221675.1 hypothetical protein E4T41_06979 [Aureobasidium subglaciale]KAI5259090.1 hypothetical protein E4T46_06957 [Aureobasidium subglaciale]
MFFPSSAIVAPLLFVTPMATLVDTTYSTVLSFDMMDIDHSFTPHGIKHKLNDLYMSVDTAPSKCAKLEPVTLNTADQATSKTYEKHIMRDWLDLLHLTPANHVHLVDSCREFAMESIFYRSNHNSYSFDFALLQHSAGTAVTAVSKSPSQDQNIHIFQRVDCQIIHNTFGLRHKKTMPRAISRINAVDMDFHITQAAPAPAASLDHDINMISSPATTEFVSNFNHSPTPSYLSERIDSFEGLMNLSGDLNETPALRYLDEAMKYRNKRRRAINKLYKLDSVTLRVIKADGFLKARHESKLKARNIPEFTAEEVNDFHDDMISIIRYDKNQNKGDDIVRAFNKAIVDDPIAEGEAFIAFAEEEGLVAFEAEDEQSDTEVDDGDDEAEASAEEATVTPDGME